VLLATDPTPDYTDITPWLATPTKWKYSTIYRVNDQQVGRWSNEVSLPGGAGNKPGQRQRTLSFGWAIVFSSLETTSAW